MNDHPTILRIQSKREAKEAIRQHFWPSFAAGTLYALPVTAVTMLSMLMPIVLQNYSPWMNAALLLVDLLLLSPLYYGFGLYCVGRSRGAEVTVASVVEPLGNLRVYLRSLAVSLAIFIRVLPLMAIRLLLSYTVPAGSAIYPIADVLIGLGLILENCLKTAMSGAYNWLYDDPEMSGWHAVAEARALYGNRIYSVLIFLLSFIGWSLLAGFSLGGLLPFVMVYQNTAFARMTDLLRFGESSEPPQESNL